MADPQKFNEHVTIGECVPVPGDILAFTPASRIGAIAVAKPADGIATGLLSLAAAGGIDRAVDAVRSGLRRTRLEGAA